MFGSTLKAVIFGAFAGAVALAAGAPAGAVVPEADIAGAADHPLIDRYPGSVIDEYEILEFNSFDLAVGPEKNRQIESNKSLEGRVTIGSNWSTGRSSALPQS